MQLKKFQEDTIERLRKAFLNAWQTGERRIPLILKSPTGSGKTIMAAEFLRGLVGDPQFQEQKAYVWVSISDEIVMQSKKKLFKVYDGAGEVNLLDLNDLSNKSRMKNNNVFFVNWQKIKATNKDGRKLRRESEKSRSDLGIFDEFIENTKRAGIELVMIIDEAHMGSKTALSQEIFDLINPRIIFKITATPEGNEELEAYRKGTFVETKREDVVREELIKDKIITQTKEDLERVTEHSYDEDKMLLEFAYRKRLELLSYYQELGLDINPLVLIQLPNDDQATKESMQKTKEETVKDFLKTKGIPDEEIAIWLSEKKENLEYVEKNNSMVSFLIFKQAAATGWDCPRAGVLVMFREIKSATFHTQTVGRILRMPEAKHYPIPELNTGYLYTNYERKDIKIPDQAGPNKAFIYKAQKKAHIEPLKLLSTYLGRIDYNDLNYTFQDVLFTVLNKYFDIDDTGMTDFAENQKKLEKIGVRIQETYITHSMIVDVVIENYDRFIDDLKKSGSDYETNISLGDLERLYDLHVYNLIAGQEVDTRRYAPARSWKAFRNAITTWFVEYINPKRPEFKAMFINDLQRPDSIFREVIGEALEIYKPIRLAETKAKEIRQEQDIQVTVPRLETFYTDDYSEFIDYTLEKCVVEPFYFHHKNFKNEMDFMKYLEESESVDWWYKNGDSGLEYFAVKYFDEFKNTERLFYPDWIGKLKNGKIFIIDTKQGFTATSSETKNKAEALQAWIQTQTKLDIVGGIAVQVGGIWKLNTHKVYKVDRDYSEFESLGEVLK
ncbi:DEAD/DEAH box helicase family protein [Candidatus Gracilibacteria bacterium]|nr:DEAD/DEAH box helicase family protein [Candidatus Gracilibacteria bacterium]